MASFLLRMGLVVALAGVLLAAGCGDETETNPLSLEEVVIEGQAQEEIDTLPLCEDAIEDPTLLDESRECREIPSCEELASGEVDDPPPDGECIDPAALVEP